MSEELGTLVIFDHSEYGSVNNTTVMYIHPLQDKEKRLELFAELTGYPLEHERYNTEIVDLNNFYFGFNYGADVSKEERLIKQFAPELLEPSKTGEVYSRKLLRQHDHLDRQTWLNRLYPEVDEFLAETISTQTLKRKKEA